MDDWEKFNDTLLPEIEDYYNHLNMEYIANVNFTHIKGVRKNFAIKNLGGYHDFYIQSDILLLADVFKTTFRICFCTRIIIGSTFKKIKVKLDLFTDIDMLLMVEKSVIEGKCYASH